MNKKVIFIAIITLMALGALAFYTVGPGSRAVAPTVNPGSLQPTPTHVSSTTTLNTYHNRDLVEDYYTFQVPQNWQLQANKVGGYKFSFSGGTANIDTIDVPDNSTLELFVLSQEEPKLKASVSGYSRISYQKVSVNGSDAYQLVYSSTSNGTAYQTMQTYITGADKAGLIILSVAANQVKTYTDTFNTIIDSFKWEK